MFNYDKANRLTKANFGLHTGSWSDNAGQYDLPGITYDPNGNIAAMTRHDQNGTPTAMSYFYLTGTNKLDHVGNLNGQSAGNYTYDANGNLTSDLAKIGSGLMSYNTRNLPVAIPVNNQYGAATIQMDYDPTGQRMLKNDRYYVRDKDGRTIAVYDLATDQLLYWNIWGLDLIGQKVKQ